MNIPTSELIKDRLVNDLLSAWFPACGNSFAIRTFSGRYSFCQKLGISILGDSCNKAVDSLDR